MLKCHKCGQEKPLNEMRKKSSSKTGYLSMCKACQAKQRVENGEYRRESVRRFAKASGQKVPLVTETDLLAIAEEYPNCAYCDVKLTQDIRSYDHVYPTSVEYGGANIPDNLVCACKYCNSQKRNRSVHEFFLSSKKFTPALYRKFVKKFTSRLIRREITDFEVEQMLEIFKAEAEIHKRDRNTESKQVKKIV